MPKDILTVRIHPEMKTSLDVIAEATSRDRSFVINEALAAYIDLFQWQIDHIKQGIRDAEEGNFATEEQVKQTVARLKKKKKKKKR